MYFKEIREKDRGSMKWNIEEDRWKSRHNKNLAIKKENQYIKQLADLEDMFISSYEALRIFNRV